MSSGAQSSWWRRIAFRSLRSTYVRRTVATDDGNFAAYLSPNSSVKVLDPRGVAIDPVHRRFIRNWVGPSSIVWDIGANIGLFAFPAALPASSGHVYCFEPDSDFAGNPRRSIGLPPNSRLRMSVIDCAVLDTDGTAPLQIARHSRAMNRLAGVARWNDRKVAVDQVRRVATQRIDTRTATLHPPTAIKIDVEGAEMQVLEGGKETIARYRPSILIEVSGPLRKAVGEFFKLRNYVLPDGTGSTPVPLSLPVRDTIALSAEAF